MPSENSVQLMGNLTRDPELKETRGQPLCKFSMAINKKYKDANGEWKERVTYAPVTAWGRQAETCAKYLKKGSLVYVAGEIESRSWTTDDGSKRSAVGVKAWRVQFLDGKPKSERVDGQDPEPRSDAAQDAVDQVNDVKRRKQEEQESPDNATLDSDGDPTDEEDAPFGGEDDVPF